jgi:hypothetical protein
MEGALPKEIARSWHGIVPQTRHMASLGLLTGLSRMRMTIGSLATRTLGVGLGLLLLSGCDVMRAARDDLASLSTPKPPPPAAPVRKVPPQPVAASRPAKPITAAAAADVAAAPAAAPASAPIVEVPAPVLTGYRESELRALLGPPTSVEDRPPGKQWRYRNGKCTLDIQLYPDVETKQYGTLAYKVKSDDNTDEGRRLCLAQFQSRIRAGR